MEGMDRLWGLWGVGQLSFPMKFDLMHGIRLQVLICSGFAKVLSSTLLSLSLTHTRLPDHQYMAQYAQASGRFSFFLCFRGEIQTVFEVLC